MKERVIGIMHGDSIILYEDLLRRETTSLGFKAKFLSATAATRMSNPTEEALPKGWLDDCEVIFGNMPISRVSEAKNLKWLQTGRAGVSDYCVEGALPPDVILTSGSGSNGEVIAEHMLTQLFMLMKKSAACLSNQREHIWRGVGEVKAMRGLKITVLGLGDIGRAFAWRAHALGATITGVQRTAHAKPDYVEALYTMEGIDEALCSADVVALALPGVDSTARILSRERINALPKGTLLINVGRGNTIDEGALCEALSEGRLGGAALDVFECEPLPANSPLWDLPNTLVTPHIAGRAAIEVKTKAVVDLFLKNLRAYASGKPFERVVERKLGY